ncbi:hypothetical protein Bhyg_16022 [Pseudolycoriella hygida]|uniref:Uncharacterized protein n=1 Tax=Pseudolycoriella hygida TaxID=35572 RepID=A0A9Q0RV83_9DIPT|nr:hypothetical protein Bhyg_16022 [Pseudolycoriella hygida]
MPVFNEVIMTSENVAEDCVRPELLTIILTTSPTPSAPSTELITSVLHSLPLTLHKLDLIITFDGFTISRNDHGRLKKGQIPQSMADTYAPYIENVKSLFNTTVTEEHFDNRMHTFVSEAVNPSSMHGGHITFVRHKYRQGFGFCIKSALEYCKSKNVLVMQHDWIFVRPSPPISDLLNLMATEEEINYITFVARQTVGYKDATVIRRGDFIEDTMGCQYLSSIVSASSDEESVEKWLDFGCWLYYPHDGKDVAIRHLSGRTNLVKVEQEARIRSYINGNRMRKLNESHE